MTTRPNQRRIQDEVRQQRRALIRSRLASTGMGVLGLALLGGGLWSLNHMLGIDQWQISASSSLKRQIDRELSGMGPLDFWHSQPDALRRQLSAALPDIASIRIQRQLPNRLVIEAEARIPVALWQQEDEHIWLVDKQGEAYRPMRRNEAYNLPLLRMPRRQLAAASRLLTSMAQTDPARLAQLSELIDDGNGWKLNLARGQQWRLSYGTTAIRQLARLEALLAQPRWRSGHWRINTRLGSRWFLRPADPQGVI
jgi:cell division septal protein FtsQ